MLVYMTPIMERSRSSAPHGDGEKQRGKQVALLCRRLFGSLGKAFRVVLLVLLLTMVFPFTFTSILTYPFSSAAEPEPPANHEPIQSHWLNIAESASGPSSSANPPKRRLPKPPRRVIADDAPESAPLQRKRGWEPPAASSTAGATTTNRVVTGRFDLYGYPDVRYEDDDGESSAEQGELLNNQRMFNGLALASRRMPF